MLATRQIAVEACVLFQCVPKPSQRLAMPCKLARVKQGSTTTPEHPSCPPQGQPHMYMRNECILKRQHGRLL